MPTADEPNKIAASLIQEHGLREAMNVAIRATAEAYDEGDGYRLSVWREVKQILATKADEASSDDGDD